MQRLLSKWCLSTLIIKMSISSNALLSQPSAFTSRGAFIVFEGVDRCGKTTQCALLTKRIAETQKSEAIRFPDRTSSIGTLINSYLTSASSLNDQTIHLLFSANRWEAASGLESKLVEGTTLVCDRYAYSGVAFSSAKGLDIEWCMDCDRGLPAPDAVIFLDISVEDAAGRGQYGEERYEKVDFQRKVREMFMTMRDKEERGLGGEAETEAEAATVAAGPSVRRIPWFVLDARKSVEELQAEVSTIADRVIATAASQPINRLWLKK